MRSLGELIFPSRCIGCSQLGISICSICRKNWHPHIYSRELKVLGESYPVISAIEYSPIASRVLLSAKEANQSAADQLLIAAISHSLRFFIKNYGVGVLVPIPSRRTATRKRGRNFMQEITKSVAAHQSCKSLDILQHVRAVKDQSQLNSQQRSSNLAGALSASLTAAQSELPGNIWPLIIVDDLITTGSTLAEAIRALHTAGLPVLGAVTGAFANPYDKGVDFRKGS
jgi:predicted amidophosphoribosyltransferase